MSLGFWVDDPRLPRVSKKGPNRGSKLRYTLRPSRSHGTYPGACRRPQHLRVLPTPRLQGSSFDLLLSRLNLLRSPDIDVRRRDVPRRLVASVAVEAIHETGDLMLQIPRLAERLQSHQVLHRAVAALDLPLRHGMVGRPAGMFDPSAYQEAPHTCTALRAVQCRCHSSHGGSLVVKPTDLPSALA